MPNRDRRFEVLDQLPTRDLWPEIERRKPSPTPAIDAPRHRALTIALAFVVSVLGVGVAIRSFVGDDGDGTASSSTMQPPPKAGPIAFEVNAVGDVNEIYVMNPDGSGITRITDNRLQDSEPAWSPDGTRLVIAGEEEVREDLSHLYIVDPATGERIRLNTTALDATSPAWSPDGSRIAFTGFGEHGYEIYVVSVDGTQETVLTNEPDDGVSGALDPSWSPDGDQLALKIIRYDPSNETETEALYVMRADGADLVRITDPSAIRFVDDLAWSPDGARIAFAGRSTDGHQDIYVTNADGSDQVNLTQSLASAGHPAWSPDGTRIVFSGPGEDGQSDLYVMNADGSNLTRLTRTPWAEENPAWAVQPASADA